MSALIMTRLPTAHGGTCVTVGVKPDVKIGMHFCALGVPTVGKHWGKRSHAFRFKPIHGAFSGGAVDPNVGHMIPPLVGLDLKIIEIFKRPQR